LRAELPLGLDGVRLGRRQLLGPAAPALDDVRDLVREGAGPARRTESWGEHDRGARAERQPWPGDCRHRRRQLVHPHGRQVGARPVRQVVRQVGRQRVAGRAENRVHRHQPREWSGRRRARLRTGDDVVREPLGLLLQA